MIVILYESFLSPHHTCSPHFLGKCCRFIAFRICHPLQMLWQEQFCVFFAGVIKLKNTVFHEINSQFFVFTLVSKVLFS